VADDAGVSAEGRLVAVDVEDPTRAETFDPVPGYGNLGGIWGYDGVSLEPGGGVVYTAIGNSQGSGLDTDGYGDLIVALSPDLSTVLDTNLPTAFIAQPSWSPRTRLLYVAGAALTAPKADEPKGVVALRVRSGCRFARAWKSITGFGNQPPRSSSATCSSPTAATAATAARSTRAPAGGSGAPRRDACPWAPRSSTPPARS
jgi:hypothetical protein